MESDKWVGVMFNQVLACPILLSKPPPIVAVLVLVEVVIYWVLEIDQHIEATEFCILRLQKSLCLYGCIFTETVWVTKLSQYRSADL